MRPRRCLSVSASRYEHWPITVSTKRKFNFSETPLPRISNLTITTLADAVLGLEVVVTVLIYEVRLRGGAGSAVTRGRYVTFFRFRSGNSFRLNVTIPFPRYDGLAWRCPQRPHDERGERRRRKIQMIWTLCKILHH